MHKKINIALFPFYLVFLEMGMYLSNDAYLPALPELANDLSTTHYLVQLSVMAWFLGSVVVQLFLGPLSDRYGRRPIILSGAFLFMISSAFCAFAPDVIILMIGRFFQGMSVPFMVIAGYAAVHESLEKKEAIRVLAKMTSVTIIAPALGPLAGAVMLLFLGWEWIFVALAVWGAISLILLFFGMPETLPPEKRETTIHLRNIMKQYWSVISNKNFMKNILAACFLVGGLVAWMIAGVFLVTDEFGYNEMYYGVFQGMIFGCFILGATLVKKYMEEENLNKFRSAGIGLALVGGVISVILSLLFPNFLFGMIGAVMIVTLGAGLAFPILLRLAIEASEAPMGIRMTIVSGAQMAMAGIAVAIVSVAYNGTLISLALVLLAFAILAFGLFSSAFRRTDKN